MKVSELTGALLDHLVAKADGMQQVRINEDVEERYCYLWESERGYYSGTVYRPTSDWKQAGPIIDHHRIELRWTEEQVDAMAWEATHFESGEFQYGPTPLIAAMRAFVAGKYGDNVSDIVGK